MKMVHTFTLAAFLAASLAFGHGSVTPQPVDTHGLESLGDEWLEENPYVGNKIAEKIGEHAFAENCARCHGLGAISGGIAPDLRYLEEGMDGDEWFMERIRNGAVRNGNVYMPPFEGILNQEAMWSIRAWLITVPKDE